MGDNFLKLAQAIPTAQIKLKQTKEILLTNLTIPNRIPSYVLPGNGPQFVSKWLTTLRLLPLPVKKLTTTASHKQKFAHGKLYNSTRVTRVRHSISEHHSDLDTYIPPISYAYNTQMCRAPGAINYQYSHAKRSSIHNHSYSSHWNYIFIPEDSQSSHRN